MPSPSNYPDDVRPIFKDGLVLTAKKILRILYDAASGAAPLSVSGGGGGGGGGAVTIADGADVALGAKADAAITNPASSGTAMAFLKGILTKLGGVVLAAGTAIIGKVGIDQTTPGTTNGVQLTGGSITPSGSTVTTSGNTTAGKKVVKMIFSSDFAGTVLTNTYAGGTDYSDEWRAPEGYTLAAMAYTISAGNIRISYI